jgi:hypothetical protein
MVKIVLIYTNSLTAKKGKAVAFVNRSECSDGFKSSPTCDKC